MRSHVNLLGILQLTWGGMGLLLGASLLLLALGAAAIARTTAGDPLTAGFTALLFVVFATALALGGVANAWVGRAVRQHRPPGRTGALMLAVMNLFVLPFGTALAIYTFWVLLHNDVRVLFGAAEHTGHGAADYADHTGDGATDYADHTGRGAADQADHTGHGAADHARGADAAQERA